MKATMSSLLFLSNIKTIFVNYILTPFINVMYITLLQNQFNTDNIDAIVVSTIVVSLIVSSIANVNSSIVYESNNGIDMVLLEKEANIKYYWCTKIISLCILAYIFLVINIAMLFVLGVDKVYLFRAIVISPIYVISSIVVGVVISLLGQWLSNPYFGINIITIFATLLFGSLGPYYNYPPILEKITFLFPFARGFDFIFNGEITNIKLDIVILMIWVLLLLVVNTKYKKMKLERNENYMI